MNSRLVRMLVRLYPRVWRERYGAEFEAFLEDGHEGFCAVSDIVCGAMYEHVFRIRGGSMKSNVWTFGSIGKRPSAVLAMAMSLTALAMVLGHAAVFGVVHEADEGSAAHIWQLLMAAQVPVLAVFAIRWLPQAPRQALKVLALQAGFVGANLAAVFFLT